MPNLYFYATHEDRQPVLDAILGCSFRVLQAQSDPDRPLQELMLGDAVPLTPFDLGLVAWREEFGAGPTYREYNVRDAGGAHYRRIEALGWGLIQIQFGYPDTRAGTGGLGSSTVGHSSESRARLWADSGGAFSGLGSPDAWTWHAVGQAASEINRAVRALAVGKARGRPVLPGAAAFVRRGGRLDGDAGPEVTWLSPSREGRRTRR